MNGRTTAVCMFFITDTWHTRLVRPIALRFGLEQALEHRASPRGLVRVVGAQEPFPHALALCGGVKNCHFRPI